MLATASRKARRHVRWECSQLNRRTRILSGLCASLALGGCGVVSGAVHHAQHTTAFPDVNLSGGPCAIQTITLLTQVELPPGLTPQGSPVSETGPRSLLDDTTDGSVGSVDATFQAVGSSAPTGPTAVTQPAHIVQVAEEIVDFGTVVIAQRWMNEQKANNRPNDVPMYANGVERNPGVPALGGDTLMYQLDQGAPYKPVPYDGPYIGTVYTDIQVRDGDLIYAISFISVPDIGVASLAVSVMRALIAKERSVCG
jgi:hypothetical protein